MREHAKGRETQHKGDVAVAAALADFTGRGWDVSVPFSESTAYDLIVDTPDGIFRVQVKYTKGHEVSLRRIHSNAKGYIVKKPSGGFDWLYAYSPIHGGVLLKSSFSGRTTVSILKQRKG